MQLSITDFISESMGHENESTTRIYLALLGQSVVDKANAEIIRLPSVKSLKT